MPFGLGLGLGLGLGPVMPPFVVGEIMEEIKGIHPLQDSLKFSLMKICEASQGSL